MTREEAQAEADRLTAYIQNLHYAIAVAQAQGDTVDAQHMLDSLAIVNQKRAAVFAVLNGTELTDRDRAILSIATAADQVGAGLQGVATAAGQTVAAAVAPLLPVLLIAGAVYLLVLRER